MSKIVPELPIEQRVLVTVEVAAAMLSISRSLAYELVASGEIPSVRLGPSGLIRISPDALHRWANVDVRAVSPLSTWTPTPPSPTWRPPMLPTMTSVAE